MCTSTLDVPMIWESGISAAAVDLNRTTSGLSQKRYENWHTSLNRHSAAFKNGRMFKNKQSGFQFSVEKNFVFALFCFATFCDWLAKLALLSQPMRNGKTKTNCVWFATVFPRLTPVTCICFDFWLVHWLFMSVVYWLEWYTVITLALVLRRPKWCSFV